MIKPDGQHWTLEYELNLRGGNRARAPIPLKDIDKRNAALAKKAKEAADKARAEGGSRTVGADGAAPAGAAAATTGDGSAAEAAAEGGDAGMEIDGESEEWLDAASDVVFLDADEGPPEWADDLSSA